VNLTVVAQASGSVSYQWYRQNGSLRSVIAGATDSTLQVRSMSAGDVGVYVVEVSNRVGVVEAQASLGLAVEGGLEGGVGGSGGSAGGGGQVAGELQGRWWVYEVCAKGSAVVIGHWVYDREEQRSAWISADGSEVLRWESADQLVEEAALSASGRFSVMGSRAAQSVLSGWESFDLAGVPAVTGDAAFYGAPAQLSGRDAKSGVEVELNWSNQRAESAAVFLSWDEVLGMFEAVD
jgi:hypothetical protein